RSRERGAPPGGGEGTAQRGPPSAPALPRGGGLCGGGFEDRGGGFAAWPAGPAAAAIRYPGERRWALRRERLRDGVPLSDAELADITKLADELCLAMPRPDASIWSVSAS